MKDLTCWERTKEFESSLICNCLSFIITTTKKYLILLSNFCSMDFLNYIDKIYSSLKSEKIIVGMITNCIFESLCEQLDNLSLVSILYKTHLLKDSKESFECNLKLLELQSLPSLSVESLPISHLSLSYLLLHF